MTPLSQYESVRAATAHHRQLHAEQRRQHRLKQRAAADRAEFVGEWATGRATDPDGGYRQRQSVHRQLCLCQQRSSAGQLSGSTIGAADRCSGPARLGGSGRLHADPG